MWSLGPWVNMSGPHVFDPRAEEKLRACSAFMEHNVRRMGCTRAVSESLPDLLAGGV